MTLNPRTFGGWLPAVFLTGSVPVRPQTPLVGVVGRGGCRRFKCETAPVPCPLPPSVADSPRVGPSPSLAPGRDRSPDGRPRHRRAQPETQSPRARRHRNSNAAREHPFRSSRQGIGGRNGRGACLHGSIVSHSATSICEQRNPFQSPCDPPLTVPVLRSLSTERTPSVGNSMPRASNGPLSRQLEARPSPSREGKGHLLRGREAKQTLPRAQPDRVRLATTCSKGVCDGASRPKHHR